ncbi:hypothetical protein ACRALDRAFT_1070969 [Sodiomyces alcalophilus JCM 7366]|uniref:uncharacterized protein n=1 Tax=Sodiomyces alcalophilus JCM 7366 TaxID=591952 RepID=UPI0039B4F67F
MSRYDYDRYPLEEPPRGRVHMPRHGSPYPRGPPPDDNRDDDIDSYNHHSPSRRNSDRFNAPLSNRRPRSLPPEHGLVPRDHQRHRPSAPPAVPDPPSIHHHRHPHSPPPRSRSRRRRSSRSKSTTRGPIDKARDAVDQTFSQTPAGLGVGLLGAVVGGLAARRVNDSAARARRHRTASSPSPPGWRSRHSPRSYSSSSRFSPVHSRNDSRSDEDDAAKRSRLISTAVGAVVGGLGANAVERRFEDSRERNRAEQAAWERKWRPVDVSHDRRHRHRHHHLPPTPPLRLPDEPRTPRWPPPPFEEPERGSRYRGPPQRVVVDDLDHDDDLVYDVPRRRGRANSAVGYGHQYR